MAKTPKSRKQKGKKFEEQVAKIIHQFLLDNFDEYKNLINSIDDSIGVKRDKDSGISINSKGDIELGIGKKYFPFSIECKKREDLDITLKNIFNLKKSKLASIFKNQALKNAQKYGLIPLLVFSKNYLDIFVFFDANFFGEEFLMMISEFNHLKCENYVVMLFNDFLSLWVKYQKFFEK